MADVIKLLPDHVANQIAAGEVVQRPASVVKELLENSIDAGAGTIIVVVRDAGRTLIQITDDGQGMSPTDARMCFERHATSKIRHAEDLLKVRTRGFRGEALASIAAIAHVEMKTRTEATELGTEVIIEGSRVQRQEACAHKVGTQITVRNLFFNVPARRQFLKSDAVEMKHIIEEFHRVAIAHPDVAFRLVHNDQELHHLTAPQGDQSMSAILRQRITHIFGKRYDERLVPVEEGTEFLAVHGFIGKPEFARKTRGEQYFFVNRRFIRSNYLNHAVQRAFEELVAKDQHPAWYLFLELDPSTIDINIHPTKTEIKFRDDRNVYAIVHAAVKRALGRFNITPTLDFDQEPMIELSIPAMAPAGGGSSSRATAWRPQDIGRPVSSQAWQELYDLDGTAQHSQDQNDPVLAMSQADLAHDVPDDLTAFQLHGRYILAQLRSGIVIIDRQRAHERFLYEGAMRSLKAGAGLSQKQLFPRNVELPPADRPLFEEIQDDLQAMGFGITPMGGGTYAVDGMPAEAADADPSELIEHLLEQIKDERSALSNERHELIARSMARSMTKRSTGPMDQREMHDLVDRLFACEMPYYTSTGKPTLITIGLDELHERFGD